MQRVSEQDLQRQCDLLNKHFGFASEPYTKDPAGNYKPNPGVFHLAGAYGGWKLEAMGENGTGTRDVLGAGYLPKRALLELMHAFRYGIAA
jgi:hypothetical protein